VIDFGIIEKTRIVEQQIVERFSLTPVEIPQDLSFAEGQFRDQLVTIESAAWSGGAIQYARFAVVHGPNLQIGNILCIPHPGLITPVLGADLVAVRENSVMIAADLSPVSPNPSDHAHQMNSVETAVAASPQVPSGGDLPTWAREVFSDYPLYTRVSRDQLAVAYQVFDLYPELFCTFVENAVERPSTVDDVEAAQNRYQRIHRDDDTGLRLLSAMFGSGWARRYLDHVLFPDMMGRK
jgi:hypothetical protein